VLCGILYGRRPDQVFLPQPQRAQQTSMSSTHYAPCFLRRVPQPLLRPYVERLWYSEGCCTTHAAEKVLPTGAVQLVIRLHQEPIRRLDDECRHQLEFEHAVITGAHSRPFVKATYRQSSVVGIRFRPAGASVFFTEPLGPLANLSVAAEHIWGPQ